MKSKESFLSQVIGLIENRADEMRKTLPLLLLTKSGELHPHELAQYLHNLRFLFHENQRYLLKATEVSKNREMFRLVEFLEQKTHEERDHDLWAERDLHHIDAQFKKGLTVTESAKRLIQSTVEFIEIDPRLYLAYILTTEYLTIYLGPEQLEDSKNACGVGSEELTAISHHVEADRDHVKDDLKAIADFIPQELEWAFLGTVKLFLNRVEEALGSFVHGKIKIQNHRNLQNTWSS